MSRSLKTLRRYQTYGRRIGRLSDLQKNLLTHDIQSYAINLDHLPKLAAHQPKVLEIGFGNGAHLFYQASRNPNNFYLGCDYYLNGFANLLKNLRQEKLTNIRVYQGHALAVLDSVPDHYFDHAFILFPDPWPRARHHKRRLIQQENLELLSQKIKKGGMLYIASDHEDYITWIFTEILKTSCWTWTQNPQDCNLPFWPDFQTDYMQRALAEGRKPCFIKLKNKD